MPEVRSMFSPKETARLAPIEALRISFSLPRYMLGGPRISPGLPRSEWVDLLSICLCRECAITKTQAVESRRERILFVDRRAKSAMARAQKAISAIFCQSANPTRDTVCCNIARLCGLRTCESLE